MAQIAHSDFSSTGDARSRSGATTAYVGDLLKRTSWGAVTSGALVAIGAQMLFTVLGIAIGLSVTGEPGRADAEFSTAPAVWWLITGTIALFAGGMVVGRLSGLAKSTDVLLHALTMWAVTAVFGFAVVWGGAGMAMGSAAMMRPDSSSRWSGSGMGASPLGVAGDVARTAAGGVASDTQRSGPVVTAMPDREAAKRYATTASWWTLIGLLIGIGASLAGSWVCAPDRIIGARAIDDHR